MKAPSEHTKVKAITGYFVLLFILLITLIFIYKNVSLLTRVEDSTSLHTDSVFTLVAEKDQKIIELIQSMSQLNSHLELSSKDLKKLIELKEKTPTVQKSVITQKDTVVTKPKKKKFFKRVAEVFAPSKTDSMVQVRTYTETALDTFYKESENDSAQIVVEAIQEKIKQEQHIQNLRQKRANELKVLNEQITNRIDTLLTNYQEERVLELLQKIEAGNESRKNAVKWIGSIAVIAVLLSVLFSFLLLKDIDKRNKYRKALEKSNKRAADLLNAREKIMLTITHDIKAPIGTIMGYSELLSETDLGENQKEFLKNINNATDHVYKLVYDLLDYHLLDLNKADIKLSTFNLAGFIDETFKSFIPLFKKKRIKLIGKYDADKLNQWIESDPVRLKQILNNLISNALKFTDHGSVELYVFLGSDKLTLSVRDTGKGMTEDEAEKIFNEFTRLASAQGKEGFGLGLSIVKKIIACLGGKVSVKSILGEGTEFTVIIPITIKQESDLHREETMEFPKGTKILLLDDDKIQLKLTSTMLMKLKAEVTSCNHINEALDRLKNGNYNLLITDMQMPEMNGFDLVELMRNSNCDSLKDIPVLAVSARDQINEDKMIEHGFMGVLKKPFNALEVLMKYNEYFGKDFSQNIISNSTVTNKTNAVEDVLDTRELLFFVQGDQNAMMAILESFVKESKIQIDLYRKALDAEDTVQIKALSHKIYPLVKLLGYGLLSEKLHILDQKESLHSIDEVGVLVKEVIVELNRLINAVTNYMSSIK